MTESAVLEKVRFDFPLDIRKQTEESGEFHIVGYAATTDFDMQGDVITDEALMGSSLDLLKNSTVLLNHDIKLPIGKVTKAEFDKHGLLIDVLISKTEPDIIQKIKEGILNKFSIRGEVLEREKKYMPELDRVVNVIKRMSLIEVSLVSVPANPEAKAIGWYISKALLQSEETDPPKRETGGDSMAQKETSKSKDPGEGADSNGKAEEKTPEQKEEAQPAKETPEAEAAQPEPEKEPEPAEPVSKTKEAELAKGKEEEKPVFSKAHLALVSGILDRIAETGGDAAPLAVQAKALVKWMMGETEAPPVVAPAAPKPAPTEAEIGKRISDEVKKQLDAALKGLPAQRKGLTPPEPAADEFKKTFEGLPPEKKLKVALALQQG